MFHGSTSDEATMGAYQRMRQPRTSEAGKGQLRLLVVVGSEEDFASLRELLAGTGNGLLRLEHAASPEDVLNQLGKGSYDLLLCSNQSTDNVAFQVLRQVRQHVSGVPLIFLSDPVNTDVIEVAIQTIAGHHAAPSRFRDAYATHASAFDARSAERQHLESEEVLRKLWRSVEQMADALIIMDGSGVMEYVKSSIRGCDRIFAAGSDRPNTGNPEI
jgi:CheY-like chemotaxis protein